MDSSPLLYVATPIPGAFVPATDEEILAQPCVVEALRKAREAGYRNGVDDLRSTLPPDGQPSDESYRRGRRDEALSLLDGGDLSLNEEDILAQPCVVEALRKAREGAWEEREAAGVIVAAVAMPRGTLAPFLPNIVPAAFQQAAARFLKSVGLDGYGRRMEDIPRDHPERRTVHGDPNKPEHLCKSCGHPKDEHGSSDPLSDCDHTDPEPGNKYGCPCQGFR